jgi:drug/metabolite transporter (DMT)-like permease
MHHPDGIRGLWAVVVLAAVGTAAALVLFNQLIAWTSAVVAASVTYIIPIFATIWGWIDGEALLPSHIVSGALIMLGVWVTNRMGARKRAAEKQVPD